LGVEEQEQATLGRLWWQRWVKVMLGASLAKMTSRSLPFLSPYSLSFSSFAANLDRPNHRFFLI
jgi:hypothetical protein